MNRFKRSPTIFILIVLFFGIFFAQNTWANKTLAEQIADLKAQALVLQKQLLQIQNSSFSKDLKMGDENDDVFRLQKFLNSDPDTIISSFGPGSPGNETSYFGRLTFSSVVRFQDKYAEEILYPSGLFSGNGNVDALTRKKINSLLEKENSNTSESSDSEDEVGSGTQNILDFGLGESIFSDSDDVLLTFVSNYSGIVGEDLIVYGSGFTKEGNTLYFGDNYEISGIKSSFGFLKIQVPEIPSGNYDLFFSNSNGISNKTFFVVTSKNSIPPLINSVEPSEVKYGGEVVLYGENFTSSGNSLRTSYGIISDLDSSDGKTLRFRVEPFPETPNLQRIYSNNLDVSWPIQVYVVNENGVDKKGATFTLDL